MSKASQGSMSGDDEMNESPLDLARELKCWVILFSKVPRSEVEDLGTHAAAATPVAWAGLVKFARPTQ